MPSKILHAAKGFQCPSCCSLFQEQDTNRPQTSWSQKLHREVAINRLRRDVRLCFSAFIVLRTFCVLGGCLFFYFSFIAFLNKIGTGTEKRILLGIKNFAHSPLILGGTIFGNLRAHDCKYRESLARLKKSKILIICQKTPFGELCSKKIYFNFQESIAFEKKRKNKNSGFYLQ